MRPLSVCLCTPVGCFQYAVWIDESSHVSHDYSLLNCHYVGSFLAEGSLYFYAVLNILPDLFIQNNILSDLLYRK